MYVLRLKRMVSALLRIKDTHNSASGELSPAKLAENASQMCNAVGNSVIHKLWVKIRISMPPHQLPPQSSTLDKDFIQVTKSDGAMSLEDVLCSAET